MKEVFEEPYVLVKLAEVQSLVQSVEGHWESVP